MEYLPNQSNNYFNFYFNPQHLPDLIRCGPVSATVLKRIKDPFRYIFTPAEPVSPSMLAGSLVDCLWLEPEKFQDRYTVLPPDAPAKPTSRQINAKKPSDATIKAIEFWKNLESQNKTIITANEAKEGTTAAKALADHSIAKVLHARSDKQVVLRGDCPLLNNQYENQVVQAQAMLDMYDKSEATVIDLKQTHDVSSHAIDKTVVRYEYFLQMAFYRKCLRSAGLPCDKAVLIFQRSAPPYDVHVKQLDEEYLAFGETLCQVRLDLLKTIHPKTLADNQIETLTIPSYLAKS